MPKESRTKGSEACIIHTRSEGTKPSLKFFFSPCQGGFVESTYVLASCSVAALCSPVTPVTSKALPSRGSVGLTVYWSLDSRVYGASGAAEVRVVHVGIGSLTAVGYSATRPKGRLGIDRQRRRYHLRNPSQRWSNHFDRPPASRS